MRRSSRGSAPASTPTCSTSTKPTASSTPTAARSATSAWPGSRPTTTRTTSFARTMRPSPRLERPRHTSNRRRAMGDLENRVVIITGGARGIGLGIAEAVADQGACVVLADILEEEAKESAKKLGNGHFGIKHDVRKADSAKNLVDKTLEKFGRVDVLVNNAGVGPNPAPIQDLTEEEFDRSLDINSRGAFLASDRAQNITGATFNVDCGWEMH